jgi:glutamate dehydrogenase
MMNILPKNHIYTTQSLLEAFFLSQQEALFTPSFKSFLYQFYRHYPFESAQKEGIEFLVARARTTYEFLMQKKPLLPIVRIFTPDFEQHGWESPYSVVEIVNEDMPFLVDSVTALLAKDNLKIHHINHPVVSIKRTISGEILVGEDDDFSPHSILHIHIPYISDVKRKESLCVDILNVLENVKASVDDWRVMLTRVSSLLDMKDCWFDYSRGDDSLTSSEIKDFIRWLLADHFTFLGFASIEKQSIEDLSNWKNRSGICRLSDPAISMAVMRVLRSLVARSEPLPVSIGKLSAISPVHRLTNIDYVILPHFGNGESSPPTHFSVILGLFTSIVYFQSATLIPIIREKIKYVVRRSHFSPISHAGKEMVTLLQSFPRDELFPINPDTLADLCLRVFLRLPTPKVSLFSRLDEDGQFVSCVLYIPREQFSMPVNERIQSLLQETYRGLITHNYSKVTDSLLAQLHFVIHVQDLDRARLVDELELEANIDRISRSWERSLQDALTKRFGDKLGEQYFAVYEYSFSESYKNTHTAEIATDHIVLVDKAITLKRPSFSLSTLKEKDNNNYQLVIVNPGAQLELSSILPSLENMGFRVLEETAYAVVFNKDYPAWIHEFQLTSSLKAIQQIDDTGHLVEELCSRVWAGDVQDDRFNALVLLASLTWREVSFFRAMAKYLRQIGFAYSQHYVEEVLMRYTHVAKALYNLFFARFSLEILQQNRERDEKETLSVLENLLSSVETSAEDKVLRRLLALILAMVRTNFFQKKTDGTLKPYISFKFLSARIPELPLPRPFAEIYVYSPRVEAIHLRGGKVSRGGLRWSDRREDFRTEVLGLVKAQMVKNSVIVPVGSKGGFVVKRPPSGREELMIEVVDCYRTFLRGLLDLTDNIVDGKIIPPLEVVRHDEDDPYLVVAADKGTATFSDYANEISKEYGFWLGDAFASGGSAGYDHKKMGITAKGAWISVERHFHEIDIDTRTTNFTVVGIGDMSGDVFGNGMLCSNNICLVAAFNHLHIFIDPAPNPKLSFEERKRLFDLPRSQWIDYSSDLISSGGGVFSRSSKQIAITPEMKALFLIEEDVLAPDELIRYLLRAPVDLLWNGGIGTYIKSSVEAHDKVGDRANDAVRVDGSEVRARVFAEGGNLGCTQLGRIEYARRGGCINTDAIDNSAGVDCSDHEVNIKIALSSAVANGKMSEVDRNQLLESMTSDVSSLVLQDNKLQTQILSLMLAHEGNLIEHYQRLMHILERDGSLDRVIEYLPSDDQLQKLKQQGGSLTRPELSILLAYSKLSAYQDLIDSTMPDDSYYESDLLLYFPLPIKEHPVCRGAALRHPLRREIVATVVTNDMINRVGAYFYHLAKVDTGLKGCDIARAYTVVRDIFGLRDCWSALEKLDGVITREQQVAYFLAIEKFLHHAIFWFLRSFPQPLSVSQLVANYSKQAVEAFIVLPTILKGSELESFQRSYLQLVKHGISATAASRLAIFPLSYSLCDLVLVGVVSKINMPIVIDLFRNLDERFGFSWLRSHVQAIKPQHYWQYMAQMSLLEDLVDQHRMLALDILQSTTFPVVSVFSSNDIFNNWLAENVKQVERFDCFLSDLRSYDQLDTSMIVVATKRIQMLRSLKE